MQHAASWKWPRYYWNLCKHFGDECYRTWRWELFASVPVGFFIAVISGDWKDYKTAMLATGMTLGCFAVWHLLRVPYLLHKSIHGTRDKSDPGTLAGVFGVIVMIGMLFGGYTMGAAGWNSKPSRDIRSVSQTAEAPAVAKPATVAKSAKQPPPTRAGALASANQQPPTEERRPPAPAPQTQLDRLVEVNKRMPEGDRARLAEALFDYAKVLDRANALWGTATQEGGQLSQAWASGSMSKDLEAHRKRLREIDSSAKDFAKEFRSVRDKWKYYPSQMDYIFGDAAENEGPNAVINAVDQYSDYLDKWSTVQNRDQKAVLDLSANEQSQFFDSMRQFALWKQGCDHRLDQMKNSIQ